MKKNRNSVECQQCNKERRKDFVYYRNGNYFCNIGCYKKYRKEKNEKTV